MSKYDLTWMREAIRLAKSAQQIGARPFGSVVVDPTGRHVLGEARGTQTPTDPICHSEVEAIREACRHRGRLLEDCTLYTTHELCLMCAGAAIHAKLKRVVYGSRREDLPALFRQRTYRADDLLADHSTPTVVERLMVDECVALFEVEHMAAVVAAGQEALDREVAQTPITGGLLPSYSCPDGGTCHHDCGQYPQPSSGCWRTHNAGPLSGVYPNDDWPRPLPKPTQLPLGVEHA